MIHQKNKTEKKDTAKSNTKRKELHSNTLNPIYTKQNKRNE